MRLKNFVSSAALSAWLFKQAINNEKWPNGMWSKEKSKKVLMQFLSTCTSTDRAIDNMCRLQGHSI